MGAEPRWLTLDEVLAIQEHQLARFGGLAGVKDIGLVESAVTSPINLWLYEDEKDLVALAVRYACAIPRNHGFNDGNKRTGEAALLTFLAVNGYDVALPNDLTLGLWIEACVEKNVDEAEFADFLATYLLPLP